MQDQDGERPEGDAGFGGQSEQTSPQGDKRTSIDVESLLAAMEDPRVADALGRRVQSTKDKRFAAQEKTMTDFQQKLARLEQLTNESKMPRDQAIRWMEMEDRVNELSDRKAPPTQPSTTTVGSQVAAANFDTDAFLRAAGIDPNDVGVPAIFDNGVLNPTKLAALVTRRVVSPTPKPSQAMPSGGTGVTPRSATKEEVADRIIELSREPSQHWAELTELKKQLKTF